VTPVLAGALFSVFWAGCATTRSETDVPADELQASETITQTPTVGSVEGSSPSAMPQISRKSATYAEQHFQLAQAYSAQNQFDRAIEEYKLTLIYDASSALVHTRLAAEYVKRGNVSEAIDSCKAALKLDPYYQDARLLLAGLYSSSQDHEAALAEYDRVLTQDPTHEEAMIYKSQILIETSQNDRAVKTLDGYLKRNPNSALGWYYLARAQQNLEHIDLALVAYKKALDLHDGFSQAGLAMGYLLESKGRNAEAIQAYKRLYDRSQDVHASNRLATIYLKEEKYQEALPYLESASQGDPDDMNTQVKLGLVQMELKHLDAAAQTFKNILKSNPDSDRVHYYLASLYEEQRNLDSAVQEFMAVPMDSKLYEDAILHATYLLKGDRQQAKARQIIDEAIAKRPKVASFHIFLASLEEDEKRLSSAIAVLERATGTFPENEKIKYYLGTLYDRQGNSAKALTQMEGILEINPDNADALNYIGYTYTVQGVRLSDAEKLLQRALRLRPNNGYVLDSWGWYLYTRGKTGEAIVELEKAAKLSPNEATILDHLGDAYLRHNLPEKALHQYREAQRFSRDESLKADLEKKIRNLGSEVVRHEADAQRIPANDSP
jgi:tetratricopeptide (TPR) repeat protein